MLTCVHSSAGIACLIGLGLCKSRRATTRPKQMRPMPAYCVTSPAINPQTMIKIERSALLRRGGICKPHELQSHPRSPTRNEGSPCLESRHDPHLGHSRLFGSIAVFVQMVTPSTPCGGVAPAVLLLTVTKDRRPSRIFPLRQVVGACDDLVIHTERPGEVPTAAVDLLILAPSQLVGNRGALCFPNEVQ
jgi:hypothetical protein